MNQLSLKDYLKVQDEDYITEFEIYLTDYEHYQVEIMVGISFSKIIIKILNYEVKFTEEYFNKMIGRKKFNDLYEVYVEIKNNFKKENYIIMKVSKNQIKIKLIIEDDGINMKREILFELKNIFENYPYFMQDLFNKNLELEKKLKKLENNFTLMEKEFGAFKEKYYAKFKTTLNIIIDHNGKTLNIICNSNDYISSLIDQYKSKTGLNFFEYAIRSSEKALNPDMRVEEEGLGNGSKIYLTVINGDDDISDNLNFNKNAIFRFINYKNRMPVMIPFNANEKVSALIERFRKKSNFYDDNVKFIYNAKNLNVNLTIEEAGITHNGNIFIVDVDLYRINFQFNNLKDIHYPIEINIGPNLSVFELIKRFLKEVYLKGEGFKFLLNSKQLENEDLPIKNAGFTEKSEILVETEKPLKIISLIFKFFDNDNILNINAVVNLYISALIKIIENNFDLKIKQLIFNNKEINRELTIEEAGLKNKDIIYIIKDY